MLYALIEREGGGDGNAALNGEKKKGGSIRRCGGGRLLHIEKEEEREAPGERERNAGIKGCHYPSPREEGKKSEKTGKKKSYHRAWSAKRRGEVLGSNRIRNLRQRGGRAPPSSRGKQPLPRKRKAA